MGGVSGDFSKLRSLVKGLQRLSRPTTRNELTKRMSEKALELSKECFWYMRAPDGKKWPKAIRGGNVLLVTRALVNSIRAFSNTSGFRLATPLIYAAVHNFGAIIKAKNSPYLVFQINGRWSKKKQVKIPKRQYLPDAGKLPRPWKEELERVAMDYGHEVMKR